MQAPGVQYALAVAGLSKTFAGTRALKAVDFDIRAGEVHALVGSNGSGKSTLIKVLAGFHTPDPGATASVFGVEFRLGDPHAAHVAGLRFVHQDLGLVGTLNAVDNLALGFGYHGTRARINWREQRAATARTLAELGYSIDLSAPVQQLAAVERTAVAIARALQDVDDKPALLVLDEPTATMPKPDVERLMTLLARLRGRGLAVLYVSHHLEEIFRCADRVTVFRDGTKISTEQVAGLAKPTLVSLMTGSELQERVAAPLGSRTSATLTATGLRGGLVEACDLELHAGEIVGVAGLTGSGREHLCALLFGGRARHGTVAVEGQELPAVRPDRAVRAGLGFVPADRQVDGMLQSMTLRENLTLADVTSYWRRFRHQHVEERRDARAWVASLRVKAHSTETPITSLSGGNQQKIVIGRWLRLKPSVLLLDEPTQGVDIHAKAEIHALLEDAAANGTAILIASTDEDELVRLCHRVLVFRHGTVAEELHEGAISSPRIALASLNPAPVGQDQGAS